jgi:hypothetical protein
MNKIVNLAEGGPISDFAFTTSDESDIVLLNMGFRIAADVHGMKLWVCRMCNGSMVVTDVRLVNAVGHRQAIERVRDHITIAESQKMKLMEIQD